MNSPFDAIIEEAALIWLHERDKVPCSIRRIRLEQMIVEHFGPTPAISQSPSPATLTTSRPLIDFKSLAANDDTHR
jgi:hypothetical protein